MRKWASTGAVAATLLCSIGLAGCQRDLEYHFGPLAVAVAAPQTKPAVRPIRKSRSTVVSRVIEPRVVNAGARIRNFCGQRHVRFQSGALKEQSNEKVRNDVLCRQVY